MPRNPRLAIAGFAHHVVQRGSNKQPLFRTASDRRVYLDIAEEHLREAGMRIISYCLMTNHVHLVVVPERGDSLSVWVRRVHGRYSQYFNARTGRTGALWHGRFFSCVLAPKHLTMALRYVEQNPVRALMVDDARKYPWSSCEAHLSGKLGTLLDRSEWESRGGAEGWKRLLEGPDRQPLLHLLRRCTFAGRPYGDEEFIRKMEQQTGQKWKRWPYVQELHDAEVLLSLEKTQPDEYFSSASA